MNKLNITLILTLVIIVSKAQDTNVINVESSNYFNRYIAPIQGLIISKVWQTKNEKTDSVLWETPLQPEVALLHKFRNHSIDTLTYRYYMQNLNVDTNTIKCNFSNSCLYIFERIFNDSIFLEIRLKDNPFLKKDYVITYPISEINNNDGDYDYLIKTISIEFDYCYNNQTIKKPLLISLIPFRNGISYSDSNLNEYYLTISKQNRSKVLFENFILHIFQTKIFPTYTKLNTSFKIEWLDRSDLSKKGWYDKKYYIGDIINLLDKSMIIDSISNDGKKIFIHYLLNKQKSYINKNYFTKIEALAKKNDDYIILDFWGTWCTPCVEAIPKLKLLQNKLPSNVSIISICIDKKENFEKAKNIFEKQQIKWSQIFENIESKEENIASLLNLAAFPSYIILNKTGEIVYQNIGSNGLEYVKSFIESLQKISTN